MFSFFSRHDKIKDSAHSLFAEVVNQARQKAFYTEFSVPDSLDGRFDMVILHMVILLDRFDQEMEKEEHKNIALVIRYLQEVFFDNMDQSLREMGVGDLGVGKRVKVMADAFYGRKAAYQNAFRLQDDNMELGRCLINNIYRGNSVSEDVIARLSSYIKSQIENLSGQEYSDLEKGKVQFMALADS